MITGTPFALTEYVQNAAMGGEDPAKSKKMSRYYCWTTSKRLRWTSTA